MHVLLVKVLFFSVVFQLLTDRSDLFYLIIHKIVVRSGLYSQSPKKTPQNQNFVSVLHSPETVKTETFLNDDES